ncbi:serine/threonine-protein kinase haspin [Indicator indicator]|uniref:serine/threonine-protein kinase haspin n=1 Tax=Indicator indicator TaxID=1002788 RepID=UPI0023DFC27E|nr:serine/threonine-protein kinase haspin [Indicator indicator]
MPLQLRTYSRRGGYLRLLPPPDQWVSPPVDRKQWFSSTSASSSTASAGSSVLSAASEDADFSPPKKHHRQALGKLSARSMRLRTRRGGGTTQKENRPPEPADASCPSPLLFSSPCRAANRPQRPYGARSPLLCSTPQCSSAVPRSRSAKLGSPVLGTTAQSSSALDDSLELFSPLCEQSPALTGSAQSSLESPHGDSEQLPPLPKSGNVRKQEAGPAQPESKGSRPKTSPKAIQDKVQKSDRVLRSSVEGCCQSQSSMSPQEGTSNVQAELSPSPITRGPRCSARNKSATSEEPCEDLKRDPTPGSFSCQRGQINNLHMPVVVLDPQEVSAWLSSMKLRKKADVQTACQQSGSPLGLQRIMENSYGGTKAVPGAESTCRKACISGFSAKRWGKGKIRPWPIRRKNKTLQQPNNSFFSSQMRKKGMKKNALELSVEMTNNDNSLLNNYYSWHRIRASLSFHKKKKVSTEEISYNSIPGTPAVKSQLADHQANLSTGTAQYSVWSASSMLLLAPTNYCSDLEVTDAEKVFGECHQEGPITFEECIPLDKMKNCKKIGEGVFGEVFQIKSERGPVALKIIPIEGTERVNGEAQKSFGEILPEIIISKELSLLSEESVNRTFGFISLYSVHCVQGAYPKYLLEAWDKYHKVTGSENDRPDFFGDKQLFMILEFEFGGSDLEHMRKNLSSVLTAKSILHQVTASLAVAEQELQFEHRDLHWGNVLVKKTDAKELSYVLNGTTCTIPTAGVHINIIDYTLSRLEKDGLTVFCDLSTEEELFQGTGDYQFDIYRQMKAENSNCWTDYHPHSNVLWLHYLSGKLLKDVSYKKVKLTLPMKRLKQKLLQFHRELLTFKSANDVLQNSSFFQ